MTRETITEVRPATDADADLMRFGSVDDVRNHALTRAAGSGNAHGRYAGLTRDADTGALVHVAVHVLPDPDAPTTRFAVGDVVEHGGRIATVTAVRTPSARGGVRYDIAYADVTASGPDAVRGLLGRVLSPAEPTGATRVAAKAAARADHTASTFIEDVTALANVDRDAAADLVALVLDRLAAATANA